MQQRGEWSSTLGGILRVGLSNVLKVISGVLVGFLLPRLLTLSDYGFCRTCTLYAAYVGLFSTGIIDGIALRFAGTPLEALDREAFRTSSRLFLMLEGGVALIGAAAGLILGGEACLILLWLAVFLLTNNITSYCQTLSQITGRFRELGAFTGLQSILGATAVLLLWVLGNMECRADAAVYLCAYTVGNLAVMLLYMYRWRTLIFGRAYPIRAQCEELTGLIRNGLPLMLANLCGLLLLSVDRQFVSLFFSRETYGVYAFACHVMTMITMVISAISTVLYPAMKRMSREQLSAAWQPLVKGIPLLVYCCMAVYFPLVPFVRWFLPDYGDALNTLRILFPGLAAASVTTIVVHNYAKTLGLSNRFCLQSMAVLGVSAAADLVICLLGGGTGMIAMASVVMLMLWYAVTGRCLYGRFGMAYGSGMMVLLGGGGLFWGCTAEVFPPVWGFILYTCSLLLIVTVWFRRAGYGLWKIIR